MLDGDSQKKASPEELAQRQVLRHRIKAGLQRKGASQKQLAEAVGVQDQAVSLWLRTGQISRWRLPRVAEFLETTVDWLLGEGPETAGVAEERTPYPPLSQAAREAAAVFEQLPASEQVKLLAEMREKLSLYDQLFRELSQKRNPPRR